MDGELLTKQSIFLP